VDTIILLTDIYGPDYVNTQLVADEWSKSGWKVVVPDLFVGDPVPIEHIRVGHIISTLAHRSRPVLTL
jgi:dienelactone hydrolase